MKQIIVTVAVPYAVEFIRRGCRNTEGLVVWDEGPVAFVEVDNSETSVAFSIGPRGPSGPAYDLLSFDGKTWWPLYKGSQALSVDAFLGSIGDPDGCFLATLNLSPTTLHSSRDVTRNRFDADPGVRQVDASSRSPRWASAHRSASRLLFCGGFVYQEGGVPAYFGTRSADVPTLSLRIGGLRVGNNQPGDRWHLGLSASQRRRAALRSFVFHVDDIDTACPTLEAEGYRPVLEEKATRTGGPDHGIGPAEFCADAVARAMLRPSTPASERYRTTMWTFAARTHSDRPISARVSRAIISEGLLDAPSDPEKAFGIGEEWVLKALDRLDQRFPPTLSPEDDEALSQMAAKLEVPSARKARPGSARI